MFAPDLIAVFDVDPHERMSWVISHERHRLDLALEICVGDSAREDATRNVERFARLGIPEYFAFDLSRSRLAGWRLPEEGARKYEPIVPQAGRWWSRVLELDLSVEQDGLRFFHGSAPLLDARERLSRLSSMVDEEARRADEEARRADEEARRADRLAEKLRRVGVDPDSSDTE